MKVIIYEQDSGVMAVIYPTAEGIEAIGIEGIAQKDVPIGKAYRIVDSSLLPADRTNRDSWTFADF